MAKPPALGNHPARLAALQAGEKRFLAEGFPCKKGGHLWRYVENGMACAECGDVKRKGKSNGGTRVKIDYDDADEDQKRLIKKNSEFLKRLHVEKLAALREMSHAQE